MRRIAVVLAVLLVACGGGSGDETTSAGAQPSTTATAVTAAGACGLKPLTFISERWEGSSSAPPGPGGVLWDQILTFANPNTVPVRLSGIVVYLRLAGSEGYFLKFARSTARTVPDEMIPAGRDQQRVAQAWLAAGNRPATEDLFATASANVAGAECPVPVERISTAPVPGHVIALPSCEPLPTVAPC